MGRPKLADDVRRVRKQLFLDPVVVNIAERLAAHSGQPLSSILSRMTRAGARQVSDEIVEEQRQKQDLLSSQPEQAGEDPVPELFPNAETEAALLASRAGDTQRVASVDELFEETEEGDPRP